MRFGISPGKREQIGISHEKRGLFGVSRGKRAAGVIQHIARKGRIGHQEDVRPIENKRPSK